MPSNVQNVAEGWINPDEMHFVAEQMAEKGSIGRILEVGAANGRLFSYLHQIFPDWEYVALDPWEQEQVRLQKDWDRGYFDEDNLKEVITKEMFQANCPFAEAIENYWGDEVIYMPWQFDIISMGLIGKKVNWQEAYQKAARHLLPGGIVISRNERHKKYGSWIKLATAIFEPVATIETSAAYRLPDADN